MMLLPNTDLLMSIASILLGDRFDAWRTRKKTEWERHQEELFYNSRYDEDEEETHDDGDDGDDGNDGT